MSIGEMTINTGAAQHTFDHVDCPACEVKRDKLLSGGDISKDQTFTEAAAMWTESRSLAPNLDRTHYVSPRTLRDDQQYIRALGPIFGPIPLGKIHVGHLRHYQDERSTKAGPNKVNQELSLLGRVLRRAGLWDKTFERGYQPLKVLTADVPRAMSPEEQDWFLHVAASKKKWEVVYWYSLAALQTTCSNCEMRGLHMGDANVFQEVLQVRTAHAKNSYRVRTIELSRDALWALDRLYQRARALGSVHPEDYLFPFRVNRKTYDPRQPMSESGIKRSFNEVRTAAGVPWLRHHDLRHCAITRLAEAGVPVEVIMAMAGHISPRMTRHYTHVSQAAKRKAVVDTFEKRPTPMRPKILAKTASGAE